MGLRLGMLVPEADLKMIRLPPHEELKQRGGADWLAMEAWAQEHGRDRRCQKKDGINNDQQQLTLLRWVSRKSSRFVESEPMLRGAPIQNRSSRFCSRVRRMHVLQHRVCATGLCSSVGSPVVSLT